MSADRRLVIEVGHADRPALGRHATCDSAADRHSDVLLDVTLAPRGGARDQHVLLLVEEQHDGAVDAEDAPDALEELPEHLLEREPCERHVDDALHAPQERRGALGPRPGVLLAG